MKWSWRNRFGAVLVGVVFVALLVAACGGGSDSSADEAEAATTEEAAATESAETAAPADTGAAAGGEEAAEGGTIGQVLYGVDAYQQVHAQYFEDRANELGWDVQTVNGENSQPTQDRVARDLLQADVDAMIIQPPDPVAAVGTLEAIQDAGVPVIYWGNGEIPGIEAPYIALDEREQTFEAGANAANWVKENFPGETAKMVVISIPGVPICEEFRMGEFINGVKSVDPNAELVANPDGGGVRAQSKKVMEDVLRSGEDFNILTACNGESLLGALSALEAAGRGKATGETSNDKVPETEYIFSIDGSPAEVEKLLDPSSSLMEVLMLTPYDNARKLAELVVQYANGELESDFRDSISGTLVSPDCDDANSQLELQFGETVEC